MSKVYGDWERLVRATLRRDELWRICHDHSRTPSGGSTTSGTSPGSSSPVPEVAPRSLRTRVSLLNQQTGAKFKNDQSLIRGKSRTRMDTSVGSTTSGASSPVLEVAVKSLSARVSPLNHQSQQGDTKLNNEKTMRRRKSRMRLDRWILTRWRSITFRTQLTDA
ncbi:hypothetical protein Salat_0899200 [Sesamum alatum]|uniref:Uncharacterized protein n=1 Tax=Sesamum alatum TaxID=300844 RepID=A0AAE1YKE4_9LAMI|nr:hypothetical protein Salat_0899200 [Sesamum alatum]